MSREILSPFGSDEVDEIEHAIATIERFTLSHEEHDLPTLEHLELQNDTLKLKPLSSIEKTLSCLMEAVSQGKRLEKKQKQKPLKGKLLHSVDVITIALLKLQNEKNRDMALQKRLLHTAHRYNATLRLVEKEPTSIVTKIKRFFFKAAGWLIDEEMQASKIRLPHSFGELQKPIKGSIAQKVSTLCQTALPKRQEIDLFRAKAHTLLTQGGLQGGLQGEHSFNVVEEALKSLRNSPVEALLRSEHLLSLKQTISPLPGEVIEFNGDFSRSKSMSIPIPESFKVAASAVQTGYPHPLQHGAIAFTKELLPSMLLRPYLAPNVEKLLKKREEIAEKLLPNGALNAKAKELLRLRKKLFFEHRNELLPYLRMYVEAFFREANIPIPKLDPSFSTEHFFEEVSALHAAIMETAIFLPMKRLEQAWISGSIKNGDDCKTIITSSVEKSASDEYKSAFSNALSKAVVAIGELLYSEKVGFTPKPLDAFSKKVLSVAFQELSDFIHELEHVPASEKELYDWIVTLLKGKIAIFTERTCSDVLVDELEAYYSLRAQA